MGLAEVTITRHDSDTGSWLMAERSAHPVLGGQVAGYCGYAEHSPRPVRRREVARPQVSLIISFGDTIDIVDAGGRGPLGTFTSFVAGIDDGFTVTEYSGHQEGVQIDLTPLGAFQLLGVPPAEFANETVDIANVGEFGELADRLASAPDWDTRFALLDAALLASAGRAPAIAPEVAWAWRQLERSGGCVSVGWLASEVGWSRRHFMNRFRHHVGLGPKQTARVLRFQRAHGMLVGGLTSISEVAATCGYADHSHLVREFWALAGCPPSQV